MSARRRRFFSPETVQTSTMDCGPAALHALLGGFGVPASYERLREVCRTDVDGTSITALAELACDLGLEAEENVVPIDHLAVPGGVTLPAIVVVRRPSGLRHFLTVWRRHGSVLQVMDPAVGRRWSGIDELLTELYVHTLKVGAADWREYAAEAHIDILARKLAAQGVRAAARDRLLAEALADPAWRSLAALDASIRFVSRLGRAGLIAPGREAERTIAGLFADAREEGGRALPPSCWAVKPATPDDPPPVEAEPEGEPQLEMSGAVVLEVKGRGKSPRQALARVLEPSAAAQRSVVRDLLRREGPVFSWMTVAGMAVSAAAVTFQYVLFRRMYDISLHLGLRPQRLGLLAIMGLFLLGLLVTDLAVGTAMARLGRRLEGRVRVEILETLPRLRDRYFASRLVSDLADRAHHAHQVHLVPSMVFEVARRAFDIAFVVAGIALVAPRSAAVAVVAALLIVVLPFTAGRTLIERELRQRTHNGSLARFYFDALVGLMPLRTHGAYRAVRYEHKTSLDAWIRAGFHALRASTLVEAVQGLVGISLAVWLLVDHLTAAREILAGGFLLLMFWALQLPAYGQELANLIRAVSPVRNAALRVTEPMWAAEAGAALPEAPASGPPSRSGGGVAVRLDDVSVRLGGQRVLHGLHLSLRPGAHVAIVGRSGAGKSTLLGVLQGWHPPAQGQLFVDGRVMSEADFEALRAETAWVDPSVQLWNRSLLENLLYAAPPQPTVPLGRALEEAHLGGVIERLPGGLQAPLGEAGALLSGGEGQRIRFGRALMGSGHRLVLLDEPFRGLDRGKRGELLGRARRFWPQATLLCVTHDVEETTSFERVLVMDEGTIVEDGRPAELLADPASRYRRFLEAEHAVRTDLWQRRGWRRLHCEEGQLACDPALGEPAEAGDG